MTPDNAGQDSQPQAKPELAHSRATRKYRNVALIIIVGLVLVVGAIGAWFLLNDSAEQAIRKDESSSQQTSEQIEKVEDLLSTLHESYFANDSQFEMQELEFSEGSPSNALVYSEQIDQFVLLESPDNWHSYYLHKGFEQAFVADQVDEDALDQHMVTIQAKETEVKDFFVQNGFGEHTTKYDDQIFESISEYDDYYRRPVVLSRENVQCELSELNVVCVDTSSLEAEAKRLAPLFDAYFASNPETPEAEKWSTVLSITNSPQANDKYPEFETISGNVTSVELGGGARADFYRKDGGVWVYSYGGHTYPECEHFANDEDSQKAFYDTICSTDEAEQNTTTVEEYYNL